MFSQNKVVVLFLIISCFSTAQAEWITPSQVDHGLQPLPENFGQGTARLITAIFQIDSDTLAEVYVEAKPIDGEGNPIAIIAVEGDGIVTTGQVNEIRVWLPETAPAELMLNLHWSAVVKLPESSSLDSIVEIGPDTTEISLILKMVDPNPIENYRPLEGMVRITGRDISRYPRLKTFTDKLDSNARLNCPDFLIDRTEVTNRQFAKFLSDAESNKSHYDPRMDIIELPTGEFRAKKGRENFPVTFVNWYGAYAFARWAGKNLPTELEWILSGVGSGSISDTGAIYPWGTESFDSSKANSLKTEGFPGTLEVASFPLGASPEGVLDLLGNVAEWTLSEKIIAISDTTSQRFIIVKGGSYLDPPENISLLKRTIRDPNEKLSSVGFRCIIRNIGTN